MTTTWGPLPPREVNRRLQEAMRSAKAFDPHQARDPHTGEWIKTPGGPAIRLFATPARSEREDAASYYQTPRWRQFEADVRRQASDLGMTVEKEDLTQGIWSKTPEPSATYTVRGSKSAQLAARIGRRWNQDAVLTFRPSDNGPDAEYHFRGAGKGNDTAAVLQAAEDHGLFGATRNGDDIVVVAGPEMGGEDTDALTAFGEQLGSLGIDRYSGYADLIEADLYDQLDPPEDKSQTGLRAPGFREDNGHPDPEAPEEASAEEAP